MSTPTDLVATPLTMRLGSARLHVDLLWRAMAHPEVLMILHVGGSEAARKEWVLSRELVAAGLLGQAGIGDIRIRCADDDVEIELRSTDGQCTLLAPRHVLVDFLARTVALVPIDADIEVPPASWFDWSGGLDDLTGEWTA